MSENDRLVTVIKYEEALRRFRGMGMQPVLDVLLKSWWTRLLRQIEDGKGAQATISLEIGSLPVGLVVEELVAAYHDSAPHIDFTLDVSVVFPPLIGAVFANKDDGDTVVDAAYKRLKA